jgi:hypothetical protein
MSLTYLIMFFFSDSEEPWRCQFSRASMFTINTNSRFETCVSSTFSASAITEKKIECVLFTAYDATCL